MSTELGSISIRDLGEDYSSDSWKEYRSVLPPVEYNEEYLLEMLNDRSFDDAPAGSSLPWVPLHAWRALAQMRSVSVIEPVLRLAEGDNGQNAYDDFAKLSTEIGESAIDPLMAVLADRARSDTSRTLATKGLGALGRSSAGATRERIVEALISQIRNHPDDGWVNSAAAEALIVMNERSLGSELLRMFKEGRLQGSLRPERLTALFGPLPE